MAQPASPAPRAAAALLYWYGTTVFTSSACLLVLEIVAGRLLAPYVGVSLYTWTAIIGVILAGLSLGNWLGGIAADRGAGHVGAGVALLAASLASLAVLLLLTVVAPLVQEREMSLLAASFALVAALFFLPALLLGVITPLLTTLALGLGRRTGRVVGTLHALAALGSIVGTFASGYWLIQYFGTRTVIVAVSALLGLLALPFLYRRPSLAAGGLALLALCGVLAWANDGFADPCDRESNYFCIRVVDSSEQAPFGEARSLVLDHLLHSTNHREDPRLLLAPYVHLMDEVLLDASERAGVDAPRVFFAGGGAYTQPRAALARFAAAEVVVAELDPVVTAVARERMYAPTARLSVHHEDARVALAAYPDGRFDFLVTDVFRDVAIPYHLVTREYARLVHRKLRRGGVYALNVVDVFPDARLAKSLVKTLGSVFAHVHVMLERIPRGRERVTFVLIASDAYRPAEIMRAREGLQRRWLRITEPLLASGAPLASLPLLSDDFVPVERLVSPLLLGAEGR